jgi:ankyrin repeat protein
MFLLKDNSNRTTLQIAAIKGHIEVLEKMWEWAKDMQLNPDEIRNEVLLSKYYLNHTPWHTAAEGGKVEALGKLWDWAK